MTKSIGTSPQKHISLSANLSTEAKALIAKQQEKDQIVRETYEAVQALNNEFANKSLEVLKKCNNPSEMHTWLTTEKEVLKIKTDTLWDQNKKRLEELGLGK